MPKVILTITMLLLSAQLIGAEKDSISQILNDITITQDVYTSPLKNSDAQNIKLNMDFMHRLPKILGNADPVRYSQMLPGVQTNSEYDSGIHIYGCDNSHNLVSIDGVPVYNATHLLGLFSVFIPSHFKEMSLRMNASAENNANRLGGTMNMSLHDTIPAKVEGEYSIGAMSSQGTLKIPIDRNKALFLSLRASYLNLLYSSLLTIDDSKLKYSFGDLNATYLHKVNNKNTLNINIYAGKDIVKLEDDEEKIEKASITPSYNIVWGNILLSASWNHKSDSKEITQKIYFTGYSNKYKILNDYTIKIPSGIQDFGYNINAKIKELKYGLTLVHHSIKPQNPTTESSSIKYNPNPKEESFEGSVFISHSHKISSNLHYTASLKGNIYRHLNNKDNWYSADPSVKLSYTAPQAGKIELSYNTQHQYLHNTGFTSIGLPVEFWLSSDKLKKPQYVHSLHLTYGKEFFDGKYSINIDTYYKKLFHQIEYHSTPLDLLNSEYSLDDVLIFGNGYNYGVNIMINKCTGKLTGWLSYSYGRAKRQFDIYGEKWFPASFERPHEINFVATYRINKKIDIGTTFVYASGTPFTAPKQFYFINGNIISEYGEHNANRLPPYMRLDLSMNYDIINKPDKKAGINISVYNALMRENEIYYYLKISKQRYSYRGYSFFTKILPSISFYYQFK